MMVSLKSFSTEPVVSEIPKSCRGAMRTVRKSSFLIEDILGKSKNIRCAQYNTATNQQGFSDKVNDETPIDLCEVKEFENRGKDSDNSASLGKRPRKFVSSDSVESQKHENCPGEFTCCGNRSEKRLKRSLERLFEIRHNAVSQPNEERKWHLYDKSSRQADSRKKIDDITKTLIEWVDVEPGLLESRNKRADEYAAYLMATSSRGNFIARENLQAAAYFQSLSPYVLSYASPIYGIGNPGLDYRSLGWRDLPQYLTHESYNSIPLFANSARPKHWFDHCYGSSLTDKIEHKTNNTSESTSRESTEDTSVNFKRDDSTLKRDAFEVLSSTRPGLATSCQPTTVSTQVISNSPLPHKQNTSDVDSGRNSAATTSLSRSTPPLSSKPKIHLPAYLRTQASGDMTPGGKLKKCRRSRTVFTELQLTGLEKRFENQKYLSTPDRMELAETLSLSQLQVKTWYQNRRMKWKKQVMQGGGTEPPTKPKGRPRKLRPENDNNQKLAGSKTNSTYNRT